MNNPLSNLKLDYWYHVLTVLGSVFLFTSITVDLKGIENTTAQILSLSILCIGIGEWVNHPVLTEIVRSKRTGEIEGDFISYPRNNTKVGIIFVVLGFLFLSIGIYKLFY